MRLIVDSDSAKMPNSCHECAVCYGGFCFWIPSEYDGSCPDSGRPEWCPLSEYNEPRVMAPEDVMKLHFNDVVYFEMAVSDVVIPAIVIDVIEHMPDGDIGIVQFRMIQEPTANCDLEYYGKTWRCWTSRPDQATREATPWN